MPVFYHVHRGLKPIKFDPNKDMFMARKNTFWNKVEKEISEDYGGYIEYKITIPEHRFTKSLNPIDKSKILIVSKQNIKKVSGFFKRHKLEKRSMVKDYFGGIDASLYATSHIPKYFRYSFELHLWDFTDVNIEISEIKKL